jgi:cytochrome P450
MVMSIDLFGNLGATLHETLGPAAADGPVARDTSTGAFLFLRQSDMEQLAHDARLAGVGLTFFDLMGISDGPLRDWYSRIMFTNDGDAHRRLRSLVSRAFTPRAVEDLRGGAAELSAEAVSTVAGVGGDLFEACRLLSTRVMCRLLGVPDEDVGVFASWADALSPIFLIMTPEQIAAATAAIIDLLAYVDDLAARRRDRPGSDLITALLAVEHEGERLTHDELVTMVGNLLVAGHDTTTSQIGCSLFMLLTHPREADRVRADLSLVSSAASETIRLEPSIPIVPRTATAPISIDGTEIPAGSMVMLCSATANRDPATWKDPDRFDVARFAQPGAPRLLTFGAGPHYCLGAALARLTLEECVRATLAVDGAFQLTEDPADIPWRVVLGRAPVRLPVSPPAPSGV